MVWPQGGHIEYGAAREIARPERASQFRSLVRIGTWARHINKTGNFVELASPTWSAAMRPPDNKIIGFVE